MEFWDTFWATMWGALAGGIVGAFASWGFTRGDRRRDRDASHRATMTAHFARILDGLGRLETSLFDDGSLVPAARRDVLIALRAAALDANDAEHAVTVGARDAVQVLAEGPEDAVQAGLVGVLITEWWREEKDTLSVVSTLGRLAYDDAGSLRPTHL